MSPKKLPKKTINNKNSIMYNGMKNLNRYILRGKCSSDLSTTKYDTP